MRDLIVIGYPDAKAAEAARDALLALPREEIFRISDAVVAARDKKGEIRLSHIVRSGALNLGTGTMSGLLIGLLFLHPIFGILAGAAAGAVGEGLKDAGVSEEFVREVDDVLRPGRAALLLERNVRGSTNSTTTSSRRSPLPADACSGQTSRLRSNTSFGSPSRKRAIACKTKPRPAQIGRRIAVLTAALGVGSAPP